MGHWARIDNNNVVQEVIVITETELDTGNWGDKSKWIKTSYNTIGGKHYVAKDHQDFTELSLDQSKALRGRFAGPGFIYDTVNDIFYDPLEQPAVSWTLNTTTAHYEPPLTCPDFTSEQLTKIENKEKMYRYVWNESLYQSDNTKGWELLEEDFPNV